MNVEFNFQKKFIENIKNIFSNSLYSNFAISNKLKANIQLKKQIQYYVLKYPKLESTVKLIKYICLDIELPYCVCGNIFSMSAYLRKQQYCSNKCKQKYYKPSKETIQLRKKSYLNTCLKKYNVTNISKIDSIKEKRKITCQKKYGGNAPACNKNVVDKAKKTCIKKYNVDNAAKSIQIKQKNKKYFLEKYNVQNPYQLEKTKNINKKNLFNQGYDAILKWKNHIIPLFSREQYIGIKNQIYKWKCVKCGNEFEQRIYTTHFHEEFGDLPRCLKCYPKSQGFSKVEKELTKFCKQYFPNLKANDKLLIKPYQLDIVIDELKLAIEFNGIYWHSINAGTQLGHHLKKTELCEAKGYRLIHIWEDEWNNSRDEIKDRLISIFQNKEIIDYFKLLDRCWYSTLQFQKYQIIQPEIIIKNNYHIENCGYLKILK